MREILFKAKCTDNEEWVEGNVISDRITNEIFIGYLRGGLINIVEVKPDTICQFTGLYDNTQWEDLSDKEQEQFLLEWKNYKENKRNQKEDWKGRKIWENDIVRDLSIYLHHKSNGNDFEKYRNDGKTSIVKFCTEDVASCGCCYPEFGGSGFKAKEVNLNKCEVIGNIFDISEWLEDLINNA